MMRRDEWNPSEEKDKGNEGKQKTQDKPEGFHNSSNTNTVVAVAVAERSTTLGL
jgi:hypothetical protein